MYLARKYLKTGIHYYIRESYFDGNRIKSRDICHLGTHPEQFVIYPDDGVAFYFDPGLIEAIEKAGAHPETEVLEKIFWPFLQPETRRVIDLFSRPAPGRRQSLASQKKRCETASFHMFDQRRMHYLRFGQLDMRGIGRTPKKIYRKLLDKSRDEIEQQFMEMEKVLEKREKKNYVYAAFNVAGHFESEISRMFPQALDQETVDGSFLEELCRINEDASFWGDVGVSGGLNEYLLRYVFWFFDTEFEGSVYLEDLMWQFTRRHHGFRRPRRQNAMPVGEALSVMGITGADLSQMSVKSLTKKYRERAHRCHPDKGGNHEQFIRLNRAFRNLVKKVGKKP